MTPRRGPMSDNERALFFCLLFPPLWPFGLAIVMCWAFEGIGNWFRSLYWRWRNWRDRRTTAREE